MADFAATLRNTLGKLGEPSAEIRSKVYDKAREALQRKIDGLPSAPPAEVVQRQFDKLEAAIADVESDYGAAADPLDGLLDELSQENAPEAVLEETPAIVDVSPDPEVPEVGEVTREGVAPQAEMPDSPVPVHEAPVEPADPLAEDIAGHVEPDVIVPETGAQTASAADDDPLKAFLAEQDAAPILSEPPGGIDLDAPVTPAPVAAPSPSGRETDDLDAALAGLPAVDVSERAAGPVSEQPVGTQTTGTDRDAVATQPTARWGLLGALVMVMLLIGGAAYAYLNHGDAIRAALGIDAGGGGVPVRSVPSTVVTPSNDSQADGQQTAPQPDASVSASGDADAVDKFTQRLTEDGSEVDDGPVNGAPGTGEGSSVAEQTGDASGSSQPEAESGATAETGADGTDGAVGDQPAVLPVGQRAVFYEERTGSQAGTSFAGATIWTVSQQAPAAGMEPEPSIRAEVSVPELGLVMEMIIKRNGDDTLPASHLVEIFFRVPETFEGRGVADVQRIALKETESDPGAPLVAVPAPLDTNIFIVALNNAENAVATNIGLLNGREWIDIPMQYVSGRRALITMEKGAAGTGVFDEVLAYWQNNPL